MKTISLNGKDFSLKYTLRAFFVFESISGYPFQFGKMLDEFLLFYSFLLASNQELFKMEFEEFIELCENDLTCLLYTSPSPRDRTRSRMPSSA